MPKSINEVHIQGNVGRDAERFGNGPVKFSVATGGGKKKDGGEFPTDWHQVQIWKPEYLPLIKKGCQVELEGRISYENWEDKKTGEKKTKAVIVAQKIEILGNQTPPNSDRHDFANQPPADGLDGQGITDEDVPW